MMMIMMCNKYNALQMISISV